MIFNTEGRVVAPFSADFGEVEQAIHRVLSFDFRGQTRIQDSIYEASNCFLRDKAQKKLLLAGRIAVLFACYGAGTPHTDSFTRSPAGEPLEIAPHAFVADLPRRMLAHPK